MTLSEDFIFAAQKLLQPVSPSIFRRLLLLSSLGQAGTWQWVLTESFRSLGLVHLLVLSGSQVQFYVSHLRGFFLVVIPRRWSASVKRWGVTTAMIGGLVVFGEAAGWPAPLTRAVLTEGVLLLFPRLRWPFLYLMVIVTQLTLFPEHALKVGFYLSWFACWALKVATKANWPYWGRMLFVTCLSQGIACGMLKIAVPGWEQWVLMVCANIAIGWLFEAVLMPLLGAVLAIAGLLTLLPRPEMATVAMFAGALLHPALEFAAAVVLVAIRAFRYIGGA